MNTPERWLAASAADATARGLEASVPVLEAFARLMHVLRAADWNDGPAHGSGAGQAPAGERIENARVAGLQPGDGPAGTERGRS